MSFAGLKKKMLISTSLTYCPTSASLTKFTALVAFAKRIGNKILSNFLFSWSSARIRSCYHRKGKILASEVPRIAPHMRNAFRNTAASFRFYKSHRFCYIITSYVLSPISLNV